jgi:hypothetical protein
MGFQTKNRKEKKKKKANHFAHLFDSSSMELVDYNQLLMPAATTRSPDSS